MIRREMPPLAVLPIILIALLFSVGLASGLRPVATILDVGSPGDEEFTESFFPAESNSVETFRWTSEHATLQIPVDRPGAYRVDLALAAVKPESRLLRLTCGESASEMPLGERSGNFTASIRCETPDDTITLALDVPVVYLPPGGRALGVSARRLEATALDSADRFLIRAGAAMTIFGTLAGAALAVAALRPRRPFWMAGPVIMAGAWAGMEAWKPDLLPTITAGPAGVLALCAGLVAWLLAARLRSAALVIAVLAPLVMIAAPPRPLVRVLEGTWTAPDDAAARLFPWLAVLAVAGAALIGGPRGAWLAVAGMCSAIASLFLPAFIDEISSRWSHQISVPNWSDVASGGGAIYIATAFVMTAIALLAALAPRQHQPLNVALAAGVGIAALLAWRVEVMQLNGDEPHYFVTARSIGSDGDLELLDNYLEPLYREASYSPVGNLSVTRDDNANRYASFAPPAGDNAWYLVPDVDGWEAEGVAAGLHPATGNPPRMTGPNGAVSRPPALVPSTQQIMLLDDPCAVERLMVASPSGGSAPDITAHILDSTGTVIWEREGLTAGDIEILADSRLCRGDGPWAVVVESGGAPVVAGAIDTAQGLRMVGSGVARSWLFAGLPQDRYGSRSAAARLLLHNPTGSTVLTIVRLISPSDLTIFEVAMGLQPGETRWERVPVSGSDAIRVDVIEDAGISARLIGSLEPARFDIPPAVAVTEWALTVPSSPDRDGGVWLTVVNQGEFNSGIIVVDGAQERRLELCGLCGETVLLPGGDREREVVVRGANGQPFWPAAVQYQERTGDLHFDLGLPLLAAPLARWDAVWPVFLVPALAGILLAPGLLLLLGALGVERRIATGAAVVVAMLAPMSTYAVRLYTEILAAMLLVWALYCWHRARERVAWHAPVLVISVSLPLLHGRLTPLAVALAGLVAIDLLQRATALDLRSLMTARNLAIAVTIVAGVAALLAIAGQFAVALSTRNVERYFQLAWVLPNAGGMLLDRGSGVLPFAPWVLLGLAVPLPLHHLQRAGLLLALVYFGAMMLRAGGWQTWGSPIRYLLPVVPLVALVAVPGVIRLWRHGIAGRVIVTLPLLWSVLATMLLHWMPLSGHVTTGGRYLIDEALEGMFRFSPFRVFPTILPRPGEDWSRPIGLAILVALAALVIWIARPLVLPGNGEQGRAEPLNSLKAPGHD